MPRFQSPLRPRRDYRISDLRPRPQAIPWATFGCHGHQFGSGWACAFADIESRRAHVHYTRTPGPVLVPRSSVATAVLDRRRPQAAVSRINSAKGRRFSAYVRAGSFRRGSWFAGLLRDGADDVSDDPTPHFAYGWASEGRYPGRPKKSTISATPTAELGAVSPGDLDSDVGARASAPTDPASPSGALLSRPERPGFCGLAFRRAGVNVDDLD